MNVPLAIQPLIAVCVLGVLLWDRSRIQRRLSRLSQDQSNMDSTLSQFMQECERSLREFSRLHFSDNVNEFPPAKGRSLPYTSCRTSSAGEYISSSHIVKRQSELGSLGDVLRKKQVLDLAREGASVQEIASRFRLPQGEVALILNLSQHLTTTGKAS